MKYTFIICLSQYHYISILIYSPLLVPNKYIYFFNSFEQCGNDIYLEIFNFIKENNKEFINLFKIINIKQCDIVLCGYYCIGFILYIIYNLDKNVLMEKIYKNLLLEKNFNIDYIKNFLVSLFKNNKLPNSNITKISIISDQLILFLQNSLQNFTKNNTIIEKEINLKTDVSLLKNKISFKNIYFNKEKCKLKINEIILKYKNLLQDRENNLKKIIKKRNINKKGNTKLKILKTSTSTIKTEPLIKKINTKLQTTPLLTRTINLTKDLTKTDLEKFSYAEVRKCCKDNGLGAIGKKKY
ncbi:hypothetical protein ABK040_005018 [Willaertia magna]